MLNIQNVSKSFGGIRAVRRADFSVQKHRITALIGPNGAGKTTLMDIISGQINPDSGSVVFQGTDVTRMPVHVRARMGISRTFQQVRLFKYLTIAEHLRMVEDHDDTKLLRAIFGSIIKSAPDFGNMLRSYGIDRDSGTLVSELSYGQRKLLQIAMSLTMRHDLLLLDEPVAGVNKVMQERIERLLLELKQKGETILLIDHDMAFIRRLADHVIVLDAGAVLAEGEPDRVLGDKRVLEAYLGE